MISEAGKQAGRNIQRLGEQLKEYPTKYLLFDWWIPSAGWHFPAEYGAFFGEIVSRHNTLVSSHYINSLNTVTARNHQTSSDNHEEIRVLNDKVEDTKNKVENALNQGIKHNINITKLEQRLVNLKDESIILQLEGQLEDSTLTKFKTITSITDRLEEGLAKVLIIQKQGNDSEDHSQILEDGAGLSERVG